MPNDMFVKLDKIETFLENIRHNKIHKNNKETKLRIL